MRSLSKSVQGGGDFQKGKTLSGEREVGGTNYRRKCNWERKLTRTCQSSRRTRGPISKGQSPSARTGGGVVFSESSAETNLYDEGNQSIRNRIEADENKGDDVKNASVSKNRTMRREKKLDAKGKEKMFVYQGEF